MRLRAIQAYPRRESGRTPGSAKTPASQRQRGMRRMISGAASAPLSTRPSGSTSCIALMHASSVICG